jgi:ribosome maturation protein SDO1
VQADAAVSVPAQVALIDPGSFRVIDDLLQKEVKGPKKIETMSFAAVEDDGRIE